MANNVVNICERTANQNTVIRLTNHRIHGRIRPGQAVHEARVQGAVGVQACHTVHVRAIGHREVSAGDNLTVGLEREGKDTVIKTCVRTERRVRRTGGLRVRFRIQNLNRHICG